MTHSMPSQCTGACCVAFPLSTSWARLIDRWPYYEDGDLIANMLQALTPEDAADRRAQHGAAPIPDVDLERDHYGCRHWNTETRLCNAYDERPGMCRSYPDHAACEHCGQLSATFDLLAEVRDAA